MDLRPYLEHTALVRLLAFPAAYGSRTPYLGTPEQNARILRANRPSKHWPYLPHTQPKVGFGASNQFRGVYNTEVPGLSSRDDFTRQSSPRMAFSGLRS